MRRSLRSIQNWNEPGLKLLDFLDHACGFQVQSAEYEEQHPSQYEHQDRYDMIVCKVDAEQDGFHLIFIEPDVLDEIPKKSLDNQKQRECQTEKPLLLIHVREQYEYEQAI